MIGVLEILVNGTLFNHTSLGNSTKEIGSVTFALEENSGVSATFPSEISVSFNAVKQMMAINLALPDEYKNKTKGLFGVWNDNPDDDYTLPDGSKISSSSNDSTIHYKFGLKCEYE